MSVPQQKSSEAPRRYFKGPYRSGHGHRVVQDGPQNVVVYLPGVKITDDARPDAIMRQVNERFIPHVLPILKGDQVRFPNEDDFYHNVFSVVSGDRFDLGRYAKGEKTSSPFDTPGVVVVRCEIHPRMKAYILVLETPTYAVPDASGRFAIPDLPDGRHEVIAWHPTHGEWKGSIDVSDAKPASLEIRF